MRSQSQRPRRPFGEVFDRLKSHSRKLTGPRQAILDVLGRSAHPMTNREIRSTLAGETCDLVTIYRCMRLLEQMGMVKRFDFGDGVARYELIKEGDDGHHHHLICTKCSQIVEVDECFPAELEQKIAASNGFKFISHKLEFFGLCPECQ